MFCVFSISDGFSNFFLKGGIGIDGNNHICNEQNEDANNRQCRYGLIGYFALKDSDGIYSSYLITCDKNGGFFFKKLKQEYSCNNFIDINCKKSSFENFDTSYLEINDCWQNDYDDFSTRFYSECVSGRCSGTSEFEERKFDMIDSFIDNGFTVSKVNIKCAKQSSNNKDACGTGGDVYIESIGKEEGFRRTFCNICYHPDKGKCEPNQVTITFDKQGGSGGNNDVVATYGWVLTSIKVPSKIGYNFIGYYSKPVTQIEFGELGKYAYYGTTGKPYNPDYEERIEYYKKLDICYNFTLYAGWWAQQIYCEAGTYLSKDTATCVDCTTGNYCPYSKTYTFNGEDQGIEKCPEGSTGSDTNATSEDNCYSDCSDNNWLPANSRVCEECPRGYYCTGGKFYKQNDNQGIKTCPDGKAVPYIDSSNDYIKKATFLNKYGNCQHCSEKYDQEHKEDTNKIILTQLVGDNIWFEHINNRESNFSYTSSSRINTRTATKEEIINNKYNKYRNNYCKRNTNDLNSVIKCTEDGRASCVIEGKLKVPFPGDENNFLELAEPCRYTPDSNYD